MGAEFLFGMVKNVLEMDSGDGCTTLCMCLLPLNCTLENGKFYVMYVLQQ